MLGFRLFKQNIVPVGNDGHFLEHPVFIHHGGVVKGDPVAVVALHQRGVQIVFVLLREILLLQGVPDDEPGDLIRQHGVVPRRQLLYSGIGVQCPTADSHDVGAIPRGRRQAQIQAAQLLTVGAELVAFLGNDAYHTLALLPQASGQTLERYALAGAGVAADPPVAVGVFVVVVRVEEHRGLVVEVQPQKDTIAVAVLIGHKGKCRSYAGGQRIAAALALNVGI